MLTKRIASFLFNYEILLFIYLLIYCSWAIFKGSRRPRIFFLFKCTLIYLLICLFVYLFVCSFKSGPHVAQVTLKLTT